MAEPSYPISVIIPLADGRGSSIESIRSWTHEQQFPRELYQVVLVAPGQDAVLEHQVRALLQSHDRWVKHSASIQGMLHAGALQAQGKTFLFTEFHCHADPGALAALAQWHESHEQAGGFFNSRHLNKSYVAAAQQELFERQSAEWSQRDHWRKVLIRGFAIRRAVYQEIGGFEGEYGYYADVVLAARLHRAGHRFSFLEKAFVTHINDYTLQMTWQNARIFSRGEHAFRLNADSNALESYIGTSEKWSAAMAQRHGSPARHTCMLAQTLVLGLVGKLPQGKRCFRQLGCRLLYQALAALVPGRWPLWRVRLAIALAWLRFQGTRIGLGNQANAYEALWGSVLQEELVRLALDEPLAKDRRGISPGTFSVLQIPLHVWSETYGLEQAHGRPFRWTKPLCQWRWTLPADDSWDLVLDTGGVRSAQSCLLAAFWNGRRIPASDIHHDEEGLRIRVPGSKIESVHDLTIVCEALVPSRHGSADHRVLGLPIFGISCQADSAATQENACAQLVCAAV